MNTDNKQSEVAQHFLDEVRWTSDGLVPAIAQDYQSNDILMVAWMNREALALTVSEQRAIYWSRSRQKLWRKGEESGNVQRIKEIRLDCDQDVIMLKVEQLGGIACHTGRRSCFYRRLENGSWQSVEKVIKDPTEMYQADKPTNESEKS
ncbi:phosphoribosyl-AMP cyclohydrolase [Oceanicoccus sp. KOV_DT_Chl]|uniref:phosphoribosyl-AMP cyclohydrolase n=1 Tax=Oceanicoccus sp. KOV_DT_Chl TaxID=1904639 RepID=UPI000C7C2CEC|nr:phosphoribosyl-AMP cyclohydrolase [Oceanicoccus sp. KOV_DT_Chl]